MVINLSIFFGIGFLIAYITILREGQKQRKILEAQKLQLEVEKSEANLNFLKAQINPALPAQYAEFSLREIPALFTGIIRRNSYVK